MKIALIVIYLMAGILTANLTYSIDVRSKAVEAPIMYVAIGATWPLMCVITSIGILFGKRI